jgi:hypothetical protein
MKKIVFRIVPVLMVLMGCVTGGGAGTNGSSPGMNLDAAIKEAAAQMGGNLPAGTEIALVSVASSSARLSEYVISRLEAALVNGTKLVVVDRANLDKIREEQGFQLSGEVDDNSAKSIGKLLGAGAIVTGAFADLGDVYSLTLKAINIETATVAASYPADIAKSTRIETLLADRSGADTGTQAGRSAAPAAPAYKIGDAGPAGGLVFYDKGNNSGGWRYLEIAPVETERTAAIYLTNREEVVGSRRVGEGKENTRKFMVQFQREGGGINSAAWLCNELTVNGFDDWYLPSLDEVLYMYNNLYLNKLADLKTDRYWTSFVGYKDDIWERIFYIDFSDGSEKNFSMIWNLPTARCQVRAIRQF